MLLELHAAGQLEELEVHVADLLGVQAEPVPGLDTENAVEVGVRTGCTQVVERDQVLMHARLELCSGLAIIRTLERVVLQHITGSTCHRDVEFVVDATESADPERLQDEVDIPGEGLGVPEDQRIVSVRLIPDDPLTSVFSTRRRDDRKDSRGRGYGGRTGRPESQLDDELPMCRDGQAELVDVFRCRVGSILEVGAGDVEREVSVNARREERGCCIVRLEGIRQPTVLSEGRRGRGEGERNEDASRRERSRARWEVS